MRLSEPSPDPFDDLPVVLSQPGHAPGYIRTQNARWADLQASLNIRERVIDEMVEDVAGFAHLVDLLRPYMEQTDRTVGEALTLARRAQAS